MSATWCKECDVIDCAGNTLCLECSGPTEPFRPIEPRLTAGVCAPTFTPSLARPELGMFDLIEGITNAAARIERAKAKQS